MGNAFMSKVDDTAAAFYNPAGLGSVRRARFHLSNVQLEMNKDFMSMGFGGSIGDIFSNSSKVLSINGMRELLNDNKGKLSHSRFQVLPNFTGRYFSFGYLLSKSTRGTIANTLGAQFEFADRLDHGPYGAANLSLFGGVVKLGASVILLNRKEYFGETDPNLEVNIESDEYNKGSALIVTSGARLTVPFIFLPTFSLKLNNSSSSKFSESGAGRPDKIRSSLDVGFSLTPQIGRSTRLHFELNLKDVTNKDDDVSGSRKTGVGLELDFRRRFFLRLGYGDGFGSAGLGIKSRRLEVDLTTYAVDSTSNDFRGKEDRRFVLSLSSGL